MQMRRFRLHPGREAAVDCGVTALLALLYALTWRWSTAGETVPWAAALLAAVAVLPAAGRRRWPAAVLAVSTIASAILIAITVNPLPALAPAFCMYLIPLRFRHRDALWLLAGTLLVIAAGCAAFGGMSHGVSGRGGADQAEAVMLESSLAIIGAWLVGYSVGQRRAAAASRREQAEQLAREQLAEARRASSEERMRIARELHDVVAHSLTLIAVQAGVANHVATRQPEQAAQALSSIETLSRAPSRRCGLCSACSEPIRANPPRSGRTPSCSPRRGSPILSTWRNGPRRPASASTWISRARCRICLPALTSRCTG